MATAETQTHLPAAREHERNEAGNLLQATLVELIALSLMGKQLHWNLVGHGFRDFHLQLDELVDEWTALADTVAERSVALGHAVDGRATAVVERCELQPVSAGPIPVPVAMRELTERLADVDERVRERAGRLGEVDLGSQDVAIEVIRTLEKQLWMLRVES